jgi:hypothetical protein
MFHIFFPPITLNKEAGSEKYSLNIFYVPLHFYGNELRFD